MASTRTKRPSQSAVVETDGLCANSVDDHGLKTRKAPRLSQNNKKTSISTSIQDLFLEAEDVANGSNPDLVFEEETKENKSKPYNDLLNTKEAKRKISQYLQEEFIDNINEEPEKEQIVEDTIKPSTAEQVKATAFEYGTCNVTNTTTNQQWTSSITLKANSGTTDLFYWKLYSTIVGMDFYIFGATTRGSTRYVTHQAEGAAFQFETSTVLPQDIDADNGGEADDLRAFYWVAAEDGDGGHLLLASDQTLAAHLDASTPPENPEIFADTLDGVSDQWKLTLNRLN